MPAKKQAQQQSGFKEKLWVRYELDEKERELVKQWKPKLDELDQQILQAIGTVYRCGVSFDNARNCWLVVMQTKSPEGEHSDLLLSARGSTPLKAFKQLVYKHLELFQGKWPRPEFEDPSVVIDD